MKMSMMNYTEMKCFQNPSMAKIIEICNNILCFIWKVFMLCMHAKHKASISYGSKVKSYGQGTNKI